MGICLLVQFTLAHTHADIAAGQLLRINTTNTHARAAHLRALGAAPLPRAASTTAARHQYGQLQRRQAEGCPPAAIDHFQDGKQGRVFEWFTASTFRIGDQLGITLTECAEACLAAESACKAMMYVRAHTTRVGSL